MYKMLKYKNKIFFLRDVIGKTGMSDYNKDLWFIGERNNLTTGIWYGHDDFKKQFLEQDNVF